MCRNIIHTKAFVAGGRCTDRTFSQSKQLNRRTLWCHQKEQRIYHLSLHHTLPFQVFCASVSMTRKWFKASAKQFQMSFSASNRTTLCHCKRGQRDVVYLSRCNLTCHKTVLIYIYAVSQTQLKHDQGLFPLWGAIKKERYFTCYPCRPQLQIFQEENFGGEPTIGAPIYLSHEERADLEANLSSLHWYSGGLSALCRKSLWASQQLPALSLSHTGACCNLPTELWASPFSNLDTGRASPGKCLMSIPSKAWGITWNGDVQFWAFFSSRGQPSQLSWNVSVASIKAAKGRTSKHSEFGSMLAH